MNKLRHGLAPTTVVAVHLVDTVSTVEYTHCRHLAVLVIDREDHRVVHDLAPARREVHDDSRADGVVQHVPIALTPGIALSHPGGRAYSASGKESARGLFEEPACAAIILTAEAYVHEYARQGRLAEVVEKAPGVQVLALSLFEQEMAAST